MLWWALTKGYGSGTLRKHSRSIARITAERSIPEFMLIPVYETTHLTRKLHLPHSPENVIPGDFSQKKNGKKEKITEYEDFMEREHLAERVDYTWFYSMCTSLAVECDAFAGARRICGMRRIPSMRGWYRDHIGKFRGQNQIPIPKPAQTSRGTPVGSIFPGSPWVRSRRRNLLIFTQPTFKKVTFDNPALLR